MVWLQGGPLDGLGQGWRDSRQSSALSASLPISPCPLVWHWLLSSLGMALGGVRGKGVARYRGLLPYLTVVPQLLEEAGVGGGEGVVAQFSGADPFEGGAAERLRFVSPPAAAEESQMDRLFRVCVGQALEQWADASPRCPVPPQFARQACLEGLVGLAFAAGELPQPAQMGLGGPLGDQQLAVAEDQGGGDVNDGTIEEGIANRAVALRGAFELLITAQCSCR